MRRNTTSLPPAGHKSWTAAALADEQARALSLLGRDPRIAAIVTKAGSDVLTQSTAVDELRALIRRNRT